jgi:hypothetical protein
MATSRQEDPSRLPSSPLAPEPAHNPASILRQELHQLGVGRTLSNASRTLQTTALVNESYLRLGSGFRFHVAGCPRVLGTTDNVMRLKRDWTMARAWLRQELSP